MKMILLFLTCANQKEANKIINALLKKRLIVCVKSMSVSSSFLWQGKKDSAKEILLVMESVESKFKAIEKEVRKHHSYDAFVLLSVPITKASTGIAKWMQKELK